MGKGTENLLIILDQIFLIDIRRMISQIRKGMTDMSSAEPLEQIMDISNPMDYAHGHSVPIWVRRKAKPVHELKLGFHQLRLPS